jgi:preprotein translocase subunit Sec61beta
MAYGQNPAPLPFPAYRGLGRAAGSAFLGRLGQDELEGDDDTGEIDTQDILGDGGPIATPIITTVDEPVTEPTLTVPTPAPIPITAPILTPPIATTDEPVDVGGLQFPSGTVGIDSAGNPINSNGQIISPTGAVTGTAAVGVVLPVAQAATQIATQVAGAVGTGVTVYPAPAGAVLPAGAIGVNAAGQPINAAGQILSTTPVTGSLSSFFSQSTLISGVPDVVVYAGGAIGIIVVISMMSGKKRR